jgi:hypothetical protein
MSFASRFGRAILALACVATWAAPAWAAEDAAQAAPSYSELVARVRNGQIDVDFGALRNAYAEDQAAYDPYGSKVAALLQDMTDALKDHDCTTAMARAESILELNFVHIDAHFVSGICQRRAGNDTVGRHSIAFARGLLSSIVKSGNGKSPETAYHVVTIAEEYNVLRGLRIEKQTQSLINANGHSYDLLEGKLNDSGTPIAVYFNIDRPVAVLGRDLQPPAK